ncbi:hypothetical protein H0264_14525 [Nocardia huaxiensis]|uniref:Uncharacterized protein n=1 Tax=Nocardia huaxiensis TaxID=2755382 RepID=A0A7D6ZR58_9NOCA|nr:hypothetical protein [Nocardia huaxiensis]QLY33283.1 hypothetical protein H0264_14525 [Nocardia huaxiensis]
MTALHRAPAPVDDHCRPLITPLDCGPTTNVPAPTTEAAAPIEQCRPLITASDCGPARETGATSIAPEEPAWLHFMNTHDPSLTSDTSGLGDLTTLLADTGAAVGFTGAVFAAATVMAARQGWDPARLRNYAGGSLVLPATTAAATTSLWTPLRLYVDGAVLAGDAEWLAGALQMSVTGIPLALTAATWWWARRCNRLHTVGKRNIPATERAQRREIDAKFQAARTLATRATPLTIVTGHGRGHRQIVLGRRAEQVSQHRKSVAQQLISTTDTLFSLPYSAVRKNIGVLGGPGSGKTTGLCRLSVASHLASHERYLAAASTPQATRKVLGIKPKRAMSLFLTCKGGIEDLVTWAELKAALLASGVHPSQIGMLPADKINLWGLPAGPLRHVIEDLAPTAKASDSAQKFYEELRISLVHLIVDAPDPDAGKGPGENTPTASKVFMDRFDEVWLWYSWGGEFNADGAMVMPTDPKYKPELKAIAAACQGKQPVLPAEAARFDNLFRELDGVFDGPHNLLDKAYWFITVPGTAQKSVATSQAKAVIKLVEQVAATDHGREITFAIDEFSRVSEGASLTDACEALRSQGVACIVGAHSFESLAGTDREAKQLMKAWSGGLLCFGLEGPDEIVTLYGTRRALEPSRHTLKDRHGDEGQVRMQDALLIDPNLLRRLEPGDCVYVNRGVATWGRITPLNPDDIPLRPMEPVAGGAAQRRGRWMRAGTALIQGKGAPA